MINSTCAIIVTYGNRSELCKKTLKSCLDQGVEKILLVNNASDYESSIEYLQVASGDARVQLIINDQNLGSAGGFKVGIERLLNTGNPKFVWLLDDDNVPDVKCLKNLIQIWESFQQDEISFGPVLYCYRGDIWINDYLSVTKGVIKKYYQNNFMGFGLIHSVSRRLKNLSFSDINYPVIRTDYGPYGGMFMNFEILKKIGLPNENFFLYGDDIEYSLRFKDVNIQQYLVYQAKINEIDQTVTGKKRYFSKNFSDVKLYYSIRNHTYLSQRYIDNFIIYMVNKYLWMTFLFIIFLLNAPKNINFCCNRFRLIKLAISDGEQGKLGVTNHIR